MIIYYYTCSINWHNFGHNRCIIAAMPKSIIGHMNGIMWTSLVLSLGLPGSIQFVSFLLIIDITFSCIFLSVPSTEVVLIDEALPSEREATYFTLRVFFFISLLRVPG